MHKNHKFMNWIKTIAFVLAAVLMFAFLSDAMNGTEPVAMVNFNGFYAEPKESLDVLLIGASEVYTGFSPTKAWEQEGFTSFCLASPGLPGDMYKVALQEALQYQSPKAVVVEVNGFMQTADPEQKKARSRNVIDNMRWSQVRFDYIKDNVEKDQQINYLFPFLTYHNTWNKPKTIVRNALANNYIRFRGRSCLKGVSTFTSVSNDEKSQKPYTDNPEKFDVESLEEFLKVCKEAGLEQVLFFRAPHQRPNSKPETLNGMWDLVHAYGYDTLNCVQSGIGADWDGNPGCIDPEKDYYNCEHMNYYGMDKFTAFLAGYIAEHYNLHDLPHSAKTSEAWDKDAQQANQLFDQCVRDMEADRYCHYYEYSFVVKPKVLPKKE